MLIGNSIVTEKMMNTSTSGNKPKYVKYVKSAAFKPLLLFSWGFFVDYAVVHEVI